MDVVDAKIVSMVLLGLVSIILGLFPICIVRSLAWGPNGEGMSAFAKTVLSGLLCFGGGVLMATGFLHLLPDVHDGFATLVEEGKVQTTLPLAEIIICAGFFLVYFVEEVVHWIADRHARDEADVNLHRAISVRACSVSRETELPPSGNPGCPAIISSNDCQQSSKCELPCEDGVSCTGKTLDAQSLNPANTLRYGSVDQLIIPVSDTADCCAAETPTKVRHYKANHNHDPGHSHNHFQKTQTSPKKSHHHHHMHHGSSSLKGLLVIVALSLHEVFEGLAVGLQSDVTDVWQLFVAVASHKYVISICVGLELATTGVSRKLHAAYILVFSLVTPLGIGIGLALTDTSVDEGAVDESVTVLTLQGLAAGTILYVAFFEILERERSKSTVGMVQLLLLVTGFLAMLGLEALAGGGHGTEHEPVFRSSLLTPNITQL